MNGLNPPEPHPDQPAFLWHPTLDAAVVRLFAEHEVQRMVMHIPGKLSGNPRVRGGWGPGGKRFFPSKKATQDAHSIEAYLLLAIQESGWQRVKYRGGSNGPYRIEETVFATITRWYPMPSGWGKKRKAAYRNGRANKKPDADNIIKQVLDRGNGLLYDDDKQVEIRVIRRLASTIDWTTFECMSVKPIEGPQGQPKET